MTTWTVVLNNGQQEAVEAVHFRERGSFAEFVTTDSLVVYAVRPERVLSIRRESDLPKRDDIVHFLVHLAGQGPSCMPTAVSGNWFVGDTQDERRIKPNSWHWPCGTEPAPEAAQPTPIHIHVKGTVASDRSLIQTMNDHARAGRRR